MQGFVVAFSPVLVVELNLDAKVQLFVICPRIDPSDRDKPYFLTEYSAFLVAIQEPQDAILSAHR